MCKINTDKKVGYGCVISEMPLGTMPAAPLFPRRNRIIAALCQGLVVVEAAANSGTLITATQAIDLGRDVFVVPGSPLDPRSRGGNSLIKQGAILVESTEDILAYYVDHEPRLRQLNEFNDKDQLKRSTVHHSVKKMDENKNSAFSAREQTISCENTDHDWLNCLGLDPISIEEIIAQNRNLSASDLFTQLASLEMDDVIKRFPDGRIAKVFKE